MTKTVILVHGAWHGAWCWERFSKELPKDLSVRTVSLPGHGRETGSFDPNRTIRLSDHVNHLIDIIETTDTASGLVLIGHSMGGFVIQKMLETYRPKGLDSIFLLAPVPWTGVALPFARFAIANPWIALRSLFTWSTVPMIQDVQTVSQLFYNVSGSSLDISQYCSRMCAEGACIMYKDLMFPIRTRRVVQNIQGVPVFVLGSDVDGLFKVHEFQATAKKLGGTFKLFHGFCHNMMLDTHFTAVVAYIQDSFQQAKH